MGVDVLGTVVCRADGGDTVALDRGERGPTGDKGYTGEEGHVGPRGPRGKQTPWLKNAAPYFASIAIAVYVLVTGHARDNRIIEAQKDGRSQACNIAREDHRQDIKNLKSKQEALRARLEYLKTVKDPNSDINKALKADVPNVIEDIKQAKAGIDEVPKYCSDPNLGVPS